MAPGYPRILHATENRADEEWHDVVGLTVSRDDTSVSSLPLIRLLELPSLSRLLYTDSCLSPLRRRSWTPMETRTRASCALSGEDLRLVYSADRQAARYKLTGPRSSEVGRRASHTSK